MAVCGEETRRKIDTAREPTVSSMIVLIGRWRKNPIESANEVRFAIKTRAGPPRGREGPGRGREGEGEGRATGEARTGTGVDGCRRPKGRNKCTHCAELVD